MPDVVGRNVSPSEWAGLFPELEYQQYFPTVPPSAERVSDLVNQGEVLASSGKREEASKFFLLAARLASRTGSVELNKTVVKSALKAGLGSSARAAVEYAAQILPKDHEVQELLRWLTNKDRIGSTCLCLDREPDSEFPISRLSQFAATGG